MIYLWFVHGKVLDLVRQRNKNVKLNQTRCCIVVILLFIGSLNNFARNVPDRSYISGKRHEPNSGAIKLDRRV